MSRYGGTVPPMHMCYTCICDMRPEHTFQYERGAIEEVNWCSMQYKTAGRSKKNEGE